VDQGRWKNNDDMIEKDAGTTNEKIYSKTKMDGRKKRERESWRRRQTPRMYGRNQ
jgi:hypothetical protein